MAANPGPPGPLNNPASEHPLATPLNPAPPEPEAHYFLFGAEGGTELRSRDPPAQVPGRQIFRR